MLQDKCFWTLRYNISYSICRAFKNAKTTHRTFIQIYPRQVIFDRRCIKRTDFCTDAACYASCLAVLFCIDALIPGMAGNKNLFRCRENFNDFRGTGCLALPAASTFCNIDKGQMIICHCYRIEWTDARTRPVTKTSVPAGLVSAPCEYDSPAILNTLISKSFCRLAPAALTHDARKNWLARFSLLTGDESDCRRTFYSCRNTEVGGNIRLRNDCFGILFAACEPAGSSMCMSKDIHNLLNLWIDCYREFLCSKCETKSEYGGNSCKEYEGIFD